MDISKVSSPLRFSSDYHQFIDPYQYLGGSYAKCSGPRSHEIVVFHLESLKKIYSAGKVIGGLTE